MSALTFPLIADKYTTSVVLSDDQTAAYQAFAGFMMSPDQSHWVLKGYAGTGKSTLVTRMLQELPGLLRTIKLIRPNTPEQTIRLTATTNKACEALAQIIGTEVVTIHSLLGLRVQTDYKTQKTTLERSSQTKLENCILFIDEASFVCRALLKLIAQCTANCKIVYIGDPAQLVQVGENSAPLFSIGYPSVQLEKVVRQAEGNPIIDMATAFRNTVNTGIWPDFDLDGHHIQHLGTDEFEAAIVAEFDRPDWRNQDSKVLAWTNRRVIYYNENIRDAVHGEPALAKGDYAINNSYVFKPGHSIKTDQLVHISEMVPSRQRDTDGCLVTLDGRNTSWFLPASPEARKAALKKAQMRQDWDGVRSIETTWIDLRAAYACTVNKSQGSTYDKVFIDLNDINRCHNANQVARMLYVAVSRARHQVILTGEIGSASP